MLVRRKERLLRLISLFLLACVNHATGVARSLEPFPEQQSVPKKKTSAHRTPWTKEDVRELKAHSKARTPLPEIAKEMKRTETCAPPRP